MRALVICLVKAMFISLALGLLASFCKKVITSERLQPSKSKSLSSKVMELLSSLLLEISASLSRTVSELSDNFGHFAIEVETLPTPIILPLIVGGLLTLEFEALSVVVV